MHKGKYFGQKYELFPLPDTKISNFFPVLRISNSKNTGTWPQWHKAPKFQAFLYSNMVRSADNGRRTGKNISQRKQGSFVTFYVYSYISSMFFCRLNLFSHNFSHDFHESLQVFTKTMSDGQNRKSCFQFYLERCSRFARVSLTSLQRRYRATRFSATLLHSSELSCKISRKSLQPFLR